LTKLGTPILADIARGACAAALFAFVIAAPLHSQTVTGSVDLTAANTRYGDTFSGTSFAISPAMRADAPNAVFDAGGSYSVLAGSWSAQANADGSLFTPRVSSLMGEFAAYTSGSANGDGTHTGSFSGMARAHLLSDRAGVWIGGGGGRVWDGSLWRNLIEGEAGAWTNIPHGTLTAIVTPSKLGDTIKYTDAEGALSVFHDRAGIDVNAGFRTGSSLPIVGGESKAWGSATAAYWVTTGVAVIVSAGTYPVNFGQGFPGGRFVSAGIRLGTIPEQQRGDRISDNEDIRPFSDVTTVPVTSAASQPYALSVQPVGNATRISVKLPSATRVEIAGDFSNWDPIALTRAAGGSWVTTLDLAPGIYEMNLRIDGGVWIAPAGMPSKDDEFGQSVALLIVPKR
jgi:hypothetical protein